MTAAPETIVIDDRIYSLRSAILKLSLKKKVIGCSEEWFENNGVRSWLCKSSKGQWFQVITRWNDSPRGKLLTEQKAILLASRFHTQEKLVSVFGKESVSRLEG